VAALRFQMADLDMPYFVTYSTSM